MHLRTFPTAIRVPRCTFLGADREQSVGRCFDGNGPRVLSSVGSTLVVLPRFKATRSIAHHLATGIPARTLRRYERTAKASDAQMAEEADTFACAGELRHPKSSFVRRCQICQTRKRGIVSHQSTRFQSTSLMTSYSNLPLQNYWAWTLQSYRLTLWKQCRRKCPNFRLPHLIVGMEQCFCQQPVRRHQIALRSPQTVKGSCVGEGRR